MTDVSILAIDLAKHSFQVCATTAEGVVVSNRKYMPRANRVMPAFFGPWSQRNKITVEDWWNMPDNAQRFGLVGLN